MRQSAAQETQPIVPGLPRLIVERELAAYPTQVVLNGRPEEVAIPAEIALLEDVRCETWCSSVPRTRWRLPTWRRRRRTASPPPSASQPRGAGAPTPLPPHRPYPVPMPASAATDYDLARKLNARYLDARETALMMAGTLERFASEHEPIAPSRLLAVAQKIRREIHEA